MSNSSQYYFRALKYKSLSFLICSRCVKFSPRHLQHFIILYMIFITTDKQTYNIFTMLTLNFCRWTRISNNISLMFFEVTIYLPVWAVFSAISSGSRGTIIGLSSIFFGFVCVLRKSSWLLIFKKSCFMILASNIVAEKKPTTFQVNL